MSTRHSTRPALPAEGRNIHPDNTGRHLMRSRSLTASVAVVTASCALLAGCGADKDTGQAVPSPAAPAQQWTPAPTGTAERTAPPVPTTLPPQVADLDRADASDVAEAALTVWFTWDTTTDSGPNDGSVRATPLLTAALARMVASEVPAQGPGGDWLGWSAQQARLVPTVSASAEPVPPQTDEKAYRSYVIDQAVTMPDGTVTDHRQSVVDVVLARNDGGWEVSRVSLR